MSEGTKIAWCDDTMNFWQGCTKVSPGCQFCYAEARDQRFAKGIHLGKGAPRVRSKDFAAPLRWNEKPWVCDQCGKAHGSGALAAYGEQQICDGCGWREATFHRRRVFSLSLGDWLDDEVPIEWLADMLDVIRRCPNLDFLLLTKRPENWAKRMLAVGCHMTRVMMKAENSAGLMNASFLQSWLVNWKVDNTPPANIWIGCTVENQEYADKRIPELLKIPAVCRFISYEPALGPVDFTCLNDEAQTNPLATLEVYPGPDGCGVEKEVPPGINWIIVGGESGPKARWFDVGWARSTVEQCKAAGVACFVKQLGEKAHTNDLKGWPESRLLVQFYPQSDGSNWVRTIDKKGGDMSEWPSDLRVREFPTVACVASA